MVAAVVVRRRWPMVVVVVRLLVMAMAVSMVRVCMCWGGDCGRGGKAIPLL